VTYTIAVRNLGTKTTTGPILVTDTLQDVFTYVSISGPGWNCAATVPPNISCTHPGPLAPGDPALVLTLVVTLDAPGAFIIQNTAEVTTAGDADPVNDTSTFVFNLAERTAPVLSILGLVALILLLSTVAFFGLNRLRTAPRKR
jgi:hypothetical protein